MKVEYLKTLWMLCFEKIRKTEEEAAWNYQEILDQCMIAFGVQDEGAAFLAQLVRDERMHARLGEELVDICRRTHPECQSLS